MSTKALLLINNLTISRDTKPLVSHFSHSFNQGEIVAVVGNNGSGKTTLLKTLAGLIPAKEQRILIDNEDLVGISHQKRATTISFLQQSAPIEPYCTAKNRIAHGLMPTYGYDLFFDNNISSHIVKVAERLFITHLLDRALNQLSGGEQRLVHIAKCLINPYRKLLLLDEPSVFLDFSQQKNLLHCLKEEAENGRVIIFSSHDSGFIRKCTNQVFIIKHQRIQMLRSNYSREM